MSPAAPSAGPSGAAWFPSDTFKRATNWHAFLQAEGLPDYPALETKAAREPEWFWSALIRFLGIRFIKPYDRVLDLSRGLPWPAWCVGGTTNVVLSCIDRHAEGARRDHVALIGETEDGRVRRLTYAELAAESSRLAAGLAALGVRRGDAVGLYLPMAPEAAIAFFALARLGCVILPLFSGFGADAIATRLNDGGAVAVITADGCLRRGRPVAMKTVLDEALRQVPGLRHVVVWQRLDGTAPMQAGRDHWWHDLVRDRPDRHPAAEMGSEDPLLLVYTSGTTGKPKGTVHTHCGFLAKSGEDYLLGFDLKADDRMLWMTDMGWLVGPIQILVSTLAGATLVMFEQVLKRRAPLMNYSGGTEMGGLVATNLLYPIKPASFNGPLPGTGADIVDAEGRSVGPDQVGELVMRQACIGTTRGLWRDPERYLESYWNVIPGLWVHGDFASRDTDGYWYIHGRSDDTIKIAGKRTGPAEIEALLLATGRVADAAAIGVPDATKGAAVVCVVVPAPGQSGKDLEAALSAAVVAGLGPPFRPREVIAVSDLPKTRNMKTMRRVIRSVLTGQPAGDLSTLVNPEAVEELRRTVGAAGVR